MRSSFTPDWSHSRLPRIGLPRRDRAVPTRIAFVQLDRFTRVALENGSAGEFAVPVTFDPDVPAATIAALLSLSFVNSSRVLNMSTEVISFACQKCGRKLKVKAELAGKQAKCPGCGNPLRVPTPKGAATKSATTNRSAKEKPQQVAAGPAKTKQAEQDEFGLGRLGGGEDELFGGATPTPANAKHNPLANHVVADPGFAHTDHMISDTPKGGDSEEGFARNPLLVQMEKEQEAARQQQATLQSLHTTKSSDNPLKSPTVLVGLLFGIMIFVVAIVGFSVNAGVGAFLAVLVMMAASAGSLGVQIWGLVLVAKTADENKGLHIVLFLFIPFYNLIYTFKNWQAMKGYFGCLCVIVVTSMLASGLMVGLGVLAANQTG